MVSFSLFISSPLRDDYNIEPVPEGSRIFTFHFLPLEGKTIFFKFLPLEGGG
jgi:hypothetical protein